MQLGKLVEPLAPFMRRSRGLNDCDITALAWDSRRVLPGSLFVAQRGWELDGHSFLQEARARGARAFVVEDSLALAWQKDLAVIEVADTREAMAVLSATWFGNPASTLGLAAVTGTNGKSTTTALIAHALALAAPSGWIGTLGAFAPDFRVPATMTTPDTYHLHRLLADMVSRGVRYVAIEASSHGIEQKRLAGMAFRCAVFLNLTQDHLDYHGTLERYYEAKRMLFLASSPPQVCVVNIDDPYGLRLATELRGAAKSRLIMVGTRPEADFRLEHVDLDGLGMSIRFAFRKSPYTLKTPLVGLYNATNLVAAFAAAHAGFGLEPGPLLDRLSTFQGLGGRMERVSCGQPFDVFIDYAHTPDAMEQVIGSVRMWTSGRIIVVFGCGGNRDVEKRPLMGLVAAKLADHVIMTSDNPRWEDAGAILEDILKGLSKEVIQAKVSVEPDRQRAIEQALKMSRSGDCVLVLGKGHEEEQLVRDQKVAFSDRRVVQSSLERLLTTPEIKHV